MILDDKRNFLKIAEVSTGDMVTFKSTGEYVLSKRYTYNDGSPKKDFIIKVEINGEIKDMRLNGKNVDLMKMTYGKDTSKWIDQSACITKVNAMIAGKMQDMIVLEVTG